MHESDTILTTGMRLGRFAGVRLRLNFLFPVVALGLMWRFQDVPCGLMATAVLVFSVLVHELAHLVVARSLGGDMDEIHLWPLGGLTHPSGRGYLSDHARVLFCGPLLNLGIALTCLLRLDAQDIGATLSKMQGPISADAFSLDFLVWLMFVSNLLLFFVNFIPVAPFDAGMLLKTYLSDRFSEVEGRDLMIRIGIVTGIFGLMCGFVFDCTEVLAVATFLLLMHFHENQRWLESLAAAEDYPAEHDATEDFVNGGWDQFNFEASDLPEQDAATESLATVDAIDDVYKGNDPEASAAATDVLDSLLEKLHRVGREQLSDSELSTLRQLSSQFRQRRES